MVIMFCRQRPQVVQWQIHNECCLVRPVNISRCQEAAVLCKMDYLVLYDGAAGNMCAPWKVKWVSGQQWKVGHCLDFSMIPSYNLGK